MSKYIPGNQKHLTLNDRIYIEESLEQGRSFKDIARYLCKDPTTISKEVKAHRIHEPHFKERLFYNKRNFCVHRFTCKKTNACRKIELCGEDTVKCTIASRYRYNARVADWEYKEQLRDARTGISLTKHKLVEKDKIISPLIFQGQTPYQIITNHPELDMSVRTLYTYIDMGLFCSRNIDLKRKVKFKPRKCHKTQIRERTVFIGRSYENFCSLGLTSFAEMDTVHSSHDSKKVLLTFFLTKEKLFLAFLMNRCTPGAVRLVFDRLEKRLGTYEFLTLFEHILTDRGGRIRETGRS